METVEVKEVERVCWYHNAEAENEKRSRAGAAANALNEVYTHYKFKNISEIPANVQEWTTRRTIETNPELAKLAQVHKLESLKYEVPKWIQDAANAFSSWHSFKSTHTQYLQYCSLFNEQWVVDYDMLEEEFERSTTYRRYLTGDQLTRLERCRRFITILEEEPRISFPYFFSMLGRIFSHPFLRRDGDKFKPSLNYVLTGEVKHISAPMEGSFLVSDKNVLI